MFETQKHLDDAFLIVWTEEGANWAATDGH